MSLTVNGSAWSNGNVDGAGNSAATGFTGFNSGSYTVQAIYAGDSNYNGASGSTSYTINRASTNTLGWAIPADSVPGAYKSSSGTGIYGRPLNFYAQALGGSPSGTVTFTNGGTTVGTPALSAVTGSNMLPNSTWGISGGNWSVWDYPSTTHTVANTTAPDGTNTALLVTSTGSDHTVVQAFPTMNGVSVLNRRFSSSFWAKGSGSCANASVGFENSAVWDGGSASTAFTSVWQRYSVTVTFTNPADTAQLDTFITVPAGCSASIWGWQVEEAPQVGPYYQTTGTSGSGSVQVASVSVVPSALDTYTMSESYSGDSNYNSSSASVALNVEKAGTVTQLTVSPTTATYGSTITLASLVDTGGGAPTGTFTFYDGGSSIGSSSISSASTTNLAPYSSTFTKWSNSGMFVTPNATMGPDGSMTATLLTNNTSYYVYEIVPCSPGSVTHSVWAKLPPSSPASAFYLSVRYYDSGNNALFTAFPVMYPTNSQWQRFSYTGTAPAGTVSCWIGIELTPATAGLGVYAWGAQVENAAAAGPYVETWSGQRTASGAASTLNVSTLSAGTHTITAKYNGDANYTSSTSTPSTLTVDKATPVVTASAPLTTITYGQTTPVSVHVSCDSACGQVDYRWDESDWGTVSLDASGNFTAPTSASWTAGIHTVVINYLGNSNYHAISSNTLTITINQAQNGPVISSVTPTSGSGQTLVTINGSNFGTPTTGAKVSFNGVDALPDSSSNVFHNVISWNDRTITVAVPCAASSGPLQVTTATGATSNQVSFTVPALGTGGSPSSVQLIPLPAGVDLTHRVPIIFLGDGYTAAQMGKYRDDVASALNSLLGESPFSDYKNYFTAIRVDVESAQCGASHHETTPTQNVSNYFGTYFGCGGVDRAICGDTAKVNSAISAALGSGYSPTRPMIVVVIVNEPNAYGGAAQYKIGYFINNSDLNETMKHEIGHSFGNLADEYVGGGGSCNGNGVSAPNIDYSWTAPKWSTWINTQTPTQNVTVPPGCNVDSGTCIMADFPYVVGAYQGGDYCQTSSGVYRPTNSSKMNQLGRPYYQVNTEELVFTTYFGMDFPDGATKPNPSTKKTGNAVTTQYRDNVTFAPAVPDAIQNLPNQNLYYTWTLTGPNGSDVVSEGKGEADSEVELKDIAPNYLEPGNYKISVKIQDQTPLVKNPLFVVPAASNFYGTQGTVQWDLAVACNNVTDTEWYYVAYPYVDWQWDVYECVDAHEVTGTFDCRGNLVGAPIDIIADVDCVLCDYEDTEYYPGPSYYNDEGDTCQDVYAADFWACPDGEVALEYYVDTYCSGHTICTNPDFCPF